MKQEQFINAVMLSLNLEYLNLEDEIARAVNSEISLIDKVEKTKELLDKMVAVENNINKFKQLFINTEKTEKTEETNGEV